MTTDDVLRGGAHLAERYEIVSALGDGSFGRVYLARQLSTGQDVAVKTVRIREGDTSGDLQRHIERFRREMRLCAALSHPHIVGLRDSGELSDGTLFAVFDFVPGMTLREVLHDEGPLEQREAIRLMTQVLDALACAHTQGIVHRDLKPENIMITRTGLRRNAMVLDFGLGGFTVDYGLERARLTATHEMMGTPCYAAPEQLRGDPPSARSDVYSWGLLFLECLTGQIAMGGATTHQVLLRQLSADPVAIPPALKGQRIGRLLEAATARNVEERRVTIAGLLEVLSELEREGTSRRAAGSVAGREGERRQLTLVACRASVRRADGAPIDLEDLDSVLEQQIELYQRLAGPRDGTLISSSADRALLAFGFPRAQENDARRAVRTALHIVADTVATGERLTRERGLEVAVHVGVHSGLVIMREGPGYEIVGTAPQVAAQISDRASAGEVLLSDATRGLLRGAIECDEAGVGEHLEPGRMTTLYRARTTPTPPGLSSSAGSEPPLVERTDEVAQLMAAWERADSGHPRVVLLVGEPGVGKSRLLREMRQALPPAAWLETRCMPENRTSPLRPIVDLLQTLSAPIELIERLGLERPVMEPLLASLLSVSAEALGTPIAPDVQKERTLAMLAQIVLRMAVERPRVLAVEDLHWADPTTLEMLSLLIDELRAAPEAAAPRLCALLTARPEFAAPWNQADVTTLSVPRLSRAGVESMVRSRLRGDEPPADVVDHIAARTDGVPLFVEELTHVLLDTGALAGRTGRRQAGWETEIPGTLRELLGARLDALSTAARETAQLAAAIGREVRHDLLAASSEKEEGLLMRDVRELIDARLLQQRRSTAEGSYIFRHALVRDAAYESMLRPARQRMHRRIAATIRESFPDIAEYQPEVVAQHLEDGGDGEVAVTYWQRAGDRALRRAAYAEARQHLERGLAAVERLPASTLRTRAEVELLTTLGTVLFSTQGFASPEVEATFARALTLCDEVEGRVPPKIFSGIIGVWITRGDRANTERLLPYLEQLVQAPRDVVEALTGHDGLGIAAFWRGAHLDAQEHFDRGMPLYRSDEFQHYLVEYGADSGIFCYAYTAWNLWLLGRPHDAEEKARELIEIAEGSRDPHARSLALAFAMLLAHGRRDHAETIARSERLLAIAGEQKLFFWSVIAMCVHGAAVSLGGAPAEGIPEMRQGLEMTKMIGNRVGHAYYTTFLIEVLLATGELGEADALIDEGLALCETSLGRVHEPELWRLRGALLEARADAAGAETAYRTAITMARSRRALAWALRASTALGHLLRARGADADARTIVGDALADFAGEDEVDVRDARVLLAAMGSSPDSA